jgi:RimJ/RimL family protein N-acetyltransferase
MMAVLTPMTLEGQLARLEPMSLLHVADLAAAAAEDRGSYGHTWVPDGLIEAERYVYSALEQQAAGRALVHVVRRTCDGRVVGTTRLWDLEVFTWPPPWPPGLARGPEPSDTYKPSVGEIGSTWYAASAQRSGINVEVKLMQLTLAFDEWKAVRIAFKTDARNAQSRHALHRLGATFEGVRRAHVAANDGTVRDSAYYSILRSEWPTVRQHLAQRLAGQSSAHEPLR